MKKFLFIMLLFTGIVSAQVTIQTPAPLSACDQGFGSSMFNLNSKTPEILGALDPALYSVLFYYEESEATADTNPISPSDYAAFSYISGTIFVRVTENANPSNFATAPLALEVTPLPVANHPADLIVSENPYDGTAVFDLTQRTAFILGSQTDCTLTYHDVEAEVHSGANPILNPQAYTNTSNDQEMFVRVQNNTTGCYKAEYFYLHVTSNSMVNVNIPDPVFKNKLIQLGVDTNSDGEIQTSEALVPTYLELDALGITDLTGIQAFTNIVYLSCTSNSLTSLNVSGLPNLNSLQCNNNQLATLILTGDTGLDQINCYNNQITSINVAGLNALTSLYCNNNALTSLNISGLPIFREVNCNNNQLTSLTLNSLPAIKFLYCDSNMLTALNVNSLTSLQVVNCKFNQLTALNVGGLTSLGSLDCGNNQISALNFTASPYPLLGTLNCNNNLLTSLDISGLGNISYIDCSHNQISDFHFNNAFRLNCSYNNISGGVDFSTCTILDELYCGHNPITAVNLAGLAALTKFYCSFTEVTDVNMNDSPLLEELDLTGDAQLISFSIKNGGYYASGSYLLFGGNTALRYVCADDTNISILRYFVNLDNGFPDETVEFNSYCNFTPGGEYNTITGTTHFDLDSNGCGDGDPVVSNIRVDLSDGSAAFTSQSGLYNFYVQDYNFTVSPSFENPYFNISPANAPVNFPAIDGTVATQDFCISANGIHPDVEIVVKPENRVRPGFEGSYKIICKNKGNQTVSGTVSFSYDDNILEFISATPANIGQSPGNVQFNYINLNPFETTEMTVTLQANGPTNTPPLNIGDNLTFTANAALDGAPDDMPDDNQFSYSHVVLGSYDPNQKLCLQGSVAPQSAIGKYLHYTIDFENTGTAPAENIIVVDFIDAAKYDLSSLQIISSSHPLMTKLSGNKIEFIFENINLPSRIAEPIGGHGNVLFKIKTLQTLNVGDTAANIANIYFDYNAPIETNEAHTTFEQLSAQQFAADSSISVYPNPTKDKVKISAKAELKSVELYDAAGRILQHLDETRNSAEIDLSAKAKGVYFIKIMSAKGSKVEKIIKK